MKVVIIYNPNSTGDGKKNAEALAAELRAEHISVRVRPTTHPGHGLEIAENYATRGEEMVLISASGDGGYHEVINGALPHIPPKIIVGVLPSGNANDHATALGSGSLAKSIKQQTFRYIDTIKVSATVNGKLWTGYAHSYVGFGVTAVAAKDLTKKRPNAVTEKAIVASALFSYKYAKVKEGKRVKRYSSVVFGNIPVMSKLVKISKFSSVTDGKVEVSAIEFHSKLRLVLYLMTAATIGLRAEKSVRTYECTPLRAMAIQLDGEVYTVDPHSKLRVEVMKRSLRCVL